MKASTIVSAALWAALWVGSSASAASWKEIHADGQEHHFVDGESIRRQGNRVTLWELHDYTRTRADAPRSKAKFRSRVDQSIVDCPARAIAVTKMYFYEKNMGDGHVVHTLDIPLGLEEAPPGSLGRALVDQLCKDNTQ